MHSIRTKMLLGFGAMLSLFLLVFGSVYYLRVKATVIPLTQDLGLEVLKARSAGIGYLFRGYLNDIQTLSRDAVIVSGDPRRIIEELGRRHAGRNPDYEMLLYADDQGNYVSSLGTSGRVEDRAYWQALLKGGQNEVVTNPLVSRATGATVFVVAVAVKDAQGRPRGLVGATILLDTLSKVAGAIGIGKHGFGWVMDHGGLLIAHPDAKLRLKLNFLDSDAQGYEGLSAIGQALARGEGGISRYRRPDGSRFVTVYGPIPNTPRWGLGVSLPEDDLMGRAQGLMRDLLWGMAGLLLAVLALVILMSGRIAKPVAQLLKGVEQVGQGRLDHELDIRTGDEIQRLAESFNQMTHDLREHLRKLAQVTAEKARVDGELQAARQIQASMLPHIFPPYPHISNIQLYATMEPAKEVGGDFYDHYLLDDRRLCLCIGDVSGKGVPAALFMVIGMTILKNLARQGLPLDQVFNQANDMLCSDNGMFITVFMVVLDTETGELEYVSAGHNPPLLARAGRGVESLRSPPQLFLGGMEGQCYVSHRLKLGKGDRLFLYTDGLTEAMNTTQEMFGEARMRAAAEQAIAPDAGPCGAQDLIERMRRSVAAFTGDAPAADDLTMLALSYEFPG